MFDHFWWNILVLGIGFFAIYWIASQNIKKVSAAFFVLVFSICLGFAGYTNFGKMHHGLTYHYSEVWHYYFGSKYYKEVSHKYLYVSLAAAFRELKSSIPAPEVKAVRNLQQPFEIYNGDKAYEIFEKEARPRFSDQRWAEFKNDIKSLMDCGWSQYDWERIMDVGFNPPPSFAVVAGSIASFIKITPGTLSLIPFIDWSLIFIAAVIIFRVFGFLEAAVFLIIYLTNNLAGMYWIGGGFCRNLWFFGLIVAICALQRKKYFLAGGAYGFATGMCVFPFVYLFGAAVPLFVISLQQRKKYILELIFGALVVLGLLIAVSLVKYPASLWVDFFDKILLHSKTFFVMHLGFDKLAAFTLNTAPQDFNAKIAYFENWNILMNDRFNEHWLWYRLTALMFTTAAIYLSLRLDPKMASLLTGETILFFYALPANYYYIHLAAFGIVVVSALKETIGKGNSLRFWSLGAFLVIANLVGGFSKDWIVLNWWINLALICLLFIYITSQLLQQKFTWKKERPNVLITLVCIIPLAFLTLKPRVFPITNTNGLKTQVLVFNQKDIVMGKGWMQKIGGKAMIWPTKDHLLTTSSDVVVITKSFIIPESHRYQVTVFHAMAPDYMPAKVRFSTGDKLEVALPTWSPSVVFVEDSYVCEFPAGLNNVLITGKYEEGKKFLGINSIILKPL